MECGLCGTMLKDPCGTCKHKGNLYNILYYCMLCTDAITYSTVHDENRTVDTASLASQNSHRPQEAPYKVSPANIQIFALKGGNFSVQKVENG